MSLNDLHYRVLNANDELIAIVAHPEDAAILLAAMGLGSVRMGQHIRTTVFTVTQENEAKMADSADWTAEQILAGEMKGSQARMGQAMLDRI